MDIHEKSEQKRSGRAARPRLFERLQSGLEEANAFARGETELMVARITIPDPPPAFDAARVRSLRTQLGVSQERFSRLLNVSPKTVQSWEQGTRTPSHAAARLLQVLEDPGVFASVTPASTAGSR